VSRAIVSIFILSSVLTGCSSGSSTVPMFCDANVPLNTPTPDPRYIPCLQTFDLQKDKPYPGMPAVGGVAAGTCGGYLVWVAAPQTMKVQYLCAYDAKTQKLVAAEALTDTGGPCWGAIASVPQTCLNYNNVATLDGGATD
jgi:hypothetical protein